MSLTKLPLRSWLDTPRACTQNPTWWFWLESGSWFGTVRVTRHCVPLKYYLQCFFWFFQSKNLTCKKHSRLSFKVSLKQRLITIKLSSCAIHVLQKGSRNTRVKGEQLFVTSVNTARGQEIIRIFTVDIVFVLIVLFCCCWCCFFVVDAFDVCLFVCLFLLFRRFFLITCTNK